MKSINLIIIINLIFSSIASSKSYKLKSAERFVQIADAYEKAYFEHHPEIGLHLGKQDVNLDYFMDHSVRAHHEWQKKEDNFLLALEELNLNELKGTPLYQTYQLLKDKLESNKAIRVCREELWHINPLWGWHIMLGLIADKQPVGTDKYRQMALRRWSSFDKVVSDEINNLRLGVREGYTAPQSVVKSVIKQIKIMISMPLEQSPYFDFARRDGDPAFRQQVTEIIKNVINPALKRYIIYLENEYLPQARIQIGVSALPRGRQCYEAKIQQNTTLKISAQSIFDYGLKQGKKLSTEIAEIGLQEFGVKDAVSVFKLAKEETKHFFHSEKDILDFNERALARAKAKVALWFSVIPKTEGIIKPYPLHRAKTGAAGEYDRPSEDGMRPGIYYVNTYDPKNKSKANQEATLFHELIPGHHFQIALAMENKARHHLEQYLWNDGYEEGWALYVERLADEMGLYEDNISRLGMLANESFRTARLVIDPGIHVMNWTREQAVSFLKKHTVLEDTIIEGEVDRYIMLPAQATSYMLGKHEIDTLREIAQKRLGAKFDIKEFHYQVLKNGCVTLPMLRENILDWLTQVD